MVVEVSELLIVCKEHANLVIYIISYQEKAATSRKFAELRKT